MGNASLVTATADTESPTEPGKLSVVSDPFPENVDIDDLWDGIVQYLKFPVIPLHTAVLKSCDVTQHDGDKDFSVKVIFDGKKLDSYGYGKGDGTDRLNTNSRTTLDAEKREIRTINYKSQCWLGEEVGDDQIYCIAVSRIFKPTPPIQYEFYMEWPLETPPRRDSGDAAAGISKAIFDSIVVRLAKTQAKVIPDADSPGGMGKVVLTPDLDEFTTYDTLFQSLIAVLKEQPKALGAEVFDTSDKQFKSEFKDPAGNRSVTTVDFDQEISGEVQSVTYTNGNMFNKWFYTVHREPLRLEAYHINADGERGSDRRFATLVQMQLNAILEKSASWFW